MNNTDSMLGKAATMRGTLVGNVITIERLVDAYLSCYFADTLEKRDELVDLLFAASAGNGMPFEPKRNVFTILFKKHWTKYYEENRWYFDGLSDLIKHRNIFAHYLLDMSSEAIDVFKKTQHIRFVKFQEKTKHVEYTDTDFIEWINLSVKCINETASILKDHFDLNTQA